MGGRHHRQGMPPTRATLALLLSAGALATGCGEDPVVDRDGVLRLELTEYAVAPQDIVTKAGQVRIVARNRGVLTHNIAVVTAPDPGEDEEELGRTDTAFPGERVTEREPIVLRPGRYRLVCSIANHDNLGQYAELEVVASLSDR
jgi:hypothetical protein